MKLASDTKMDEVLYLWFAQKRYRGVPISGPILMAKALELNKKVNPGDDKWQAQDG